MAQVLYLLGDDINLIHSFHISFIACLSLSAKHEQLKGSLLLANHPLYWVSEPARALFI